MNQDPENNDFKKPPGKAEQGPKLDPLSPLAVEWQTATTEKQKELQTQILEKLNCKPKFQAWVNDAGETSVNLYEILPQALRNYNPTRATFWSYLYYICFKSKKIDEHRRLSIKTIDENGKTKLIKPQETSLNDTIVDENGNEYSREETIAGPDPTPEKEFAKVWEANENKEQVKAWLTTYTTAMGGLLSRIVTWKAAIPLLRSYYIEFRSEKDITTSLTEFKDAASYFRQATCYFRKRIKQQPEDFAQFLNSINITQNTYLKTRLDPNNPEFHKNLKDFVIKMQECVGEASFLRRDYDKK